MSVMSGSEIARLVLGYLRGQQMDQIALEFAKHSPYLQEEYSFLKRGLKIKPLDKPRTLFEVLKEFIEIEEFVTEFFDNELKQYENIPYELLQMQTLTEKVKCICQNCKLVAENGSSQGQGQRPSTIGTVASRKRPNISNITIDSSDSDSSEKSSLHTSNEQNSSNCSRPPWKRPRFDRNLIISETCEITKAQKSGDTNAETPIKVTVVAQDPTTSQMSSKKWTISGTELSERIVPEEIAQRLNESSIDQIKENAGDIAGQLITQDLLDNLVWNCVGPQNFDFLSTLSSSTESQAHSEEDCEVLPIVEDNRELNTPIPNDSTSKTRYDLRSNRKSGSGASIESKPKHKNGKPQILSNERVEIPLSALSQSRNEPIELSDSDTDAVTTTTQQQQQQQQFHVQFQPALINGSLFWVRFGDAQSQSEQPQPQSQPLFQVASSTVEFPLDSIANLPTTSNVIDESEFTVNDGPQLPIVMVPLQDGSTISDNERERIIVINGEDVTKQGCQTVQTMQIDQKSLSTSTMKTMANQSQEQTAQENRQVEQDKTDPVAEMKGISGQKVVTPKQLIKSNFPSSSRSLSTPRNKNPHVRVLDFNCTPNRFRLSGIEEIRDDSIPNTSRFFNETPHNRSIASSMPSSAPPKVDSTVQSRRISIERAIESSTLATDTFVPMDENTRISGDGETPKVRKSNRRSCVRSISSHKENNPDVNEKRLKRVATTKKKICPDDGDSNESKESNTKAETKEESALVSEEDAMAEWKKTMKTSKSHVLLEQSLREQNSKKQASELPTGRKKRPSRSKKKPAAKKKQTDKACPEDSAKSANISLDSSIDTDALNSTQLNLEARILEENLKSAKKATPVKQSLPKSAKKKTAAGKLQIKLMPSPKNKALKRLRSAKNLVSANEKVKNDTVFNNIPSDNLNVANVAAEGESVANPEANSQLNSQMSTEISDKTTELRNIEIETAQNLIKMNEILQQESERKKNEKNAVQSDSITMSQPPPEEVGESSATSESMPNNKLAAVLSNNVNLLNLSMSGLLDTPYKDYGTVFPQTPNLSNILSQLNTPMVRHPCGSLLDDSIFKNPQWPTPNFPITPGAMFSSLTPSKDVFSPRSEDIVYGAPNRPTDYSSSSSYYKPDESDGIDRQIQTNIHSSRKNSGVYSADDMDESSKIDDTTQNTSRSSSSSSSSSSDSSSSDSDSDSESSDSDTSQKGDENSGIDQNEQQQHQQQEQPAPVDNVIDEDVTQEIKSHLVSTSHVNIAQNILLSEPEAPIVKLDEEHAKLMNEKRCRVKEQLLKAEMKNHEKLKPKQTHRTINDAQRDRLRAISTISSPSKRKSTPPKKHILSEIVNVTENQGEKVVEMKVQSQSTTITARLKTEAAGDNAIANMSETSLGIRTVQNESLEETVEAIKTHISKSDTVVSEEIPSSKKNIAASNQISKECLIDILSAKRRKLDANLPKTKTEVIEALPLPRSTRSRTKNLRTTIAPAKSLITQKTLSTSSNAKTTSKTTDTSKAPRRSKENELNVSSSPKRPTQKEITVSKPAETSKIEAMKSKPDSNLETPAKQRLSRQKIREMFGDCSDIDTPMKSPPKTVKPITRVDQASRVEKSAPNTQQTDKPPASENVQDCGTKFEADSSSNVKGSDSEFESSESDSDERDAYEMTFSIDESDKERFICMRENASAISKTVAKPIVIATKKVIFSESLQISLEASDVMELYTQDVDSVAEMKKKKNKDRTRSGKAIKTDNTKPASTQSEADNKCEKPMHTSTPSPKFNIKHKPTLMVSPKSAKKQSATSKPNDFNSITIDDILHHLHPTTE